MNSTETIWFKCSIYCKKSASLNFSPTVDRFGCLGQKSLDADKIEDNWFLQSILQDRNTICLGGPGGESDVSKLCQETAELSSLLPKKVFVSWYCWLESSLPSNFVLQRDPLKSLLYFLEYFGGIAGPSLHPQHNKAESVITPAKRLNYRDSLCILPFGASISIHVFWHRRQRGNVEIGLYISSLVGNVWRERKRENWQSDLRTCVHVC